MVTKINTDKNNAKAYMHDLSLILAALGKQLGHIDDIEIDGMDKFTLAGLTLGISAQMQKLIDKMTKWGLMIPPKGE